MIEQTRFLSTAFLCSELKLEYIYSGINFCGKNACGNFLAGTTVSYCVFNLRIAGKSAKIRTRKNFVPHGIASLSKLCLFCRQLVAIFSENNKKKIVPLVED